MDNVKHYGEMFPLDETICKECAHRVSRIIVPLDLEDFGIRDEDLKELDLLEGEEVLIEHHTCLILQQDLDHLVLECNHFRANDNKGIFINNPY